MVRKDPTFGGDGFDGAFETPVGDDAGFAPLDGDDEAPRAPKGRPPVAEAFDAGELKEGVDQMRLELPQNFVRYLLGRTVVRALTEQLGVLGGVECDAGTLRCTVNLLEALVTHLGNGIGTGDTDEPGFHAGLSRVDGGFELGGIRYNGDWFNFRWLRARLRASMNPAGAFDLGAATVRFLPTHVPVDHNGYPARIQGDEAEAHFLDQTELMVGIPLEDCLTVIGPGTDPAEDGWRYGEQYIPYRLPRSCACAPEDFILGQRQSFCVIDPHARPTGANHILRTVGANRYPRQCTGEAGRGGWAREDLATLLEGFSYTDRQLRFMSLAVRIIGCNDREVHRVPPRDGDPEERLTSATGVLAGAALSLGTLRLALVEQGVNLFQLEIAVVSRWEQSLFKRWYTWILGFFLKLIRLLVEAVLTFAISAVVNLVDAEIDIDLPDLRVEVHGLLETAPDEARSRLRVTGRRLITDEFEVDGDFRIPISLPDVGRECSQLFNPDDFAAWVRSLLACPLEILEETLNAAFALLVGVLDGTFDAIGLGVDIFADAIQPAIDIGIRNVTTQHPIGRFLVEANHEVLTSPRLLEHTEPIDVALYKDQIAALAKLCPNPTMCALFQALQGGHPAFASLRAEILRVGAKTHYRSLGEFEGLDLSWDHPPVRFCYDGDDPPGAAAFKKVDAPELLDLREIDVDEDADDGKPAGMAAQCAAFVDVRLGGLVKVGDYEMFFSPTRRTEVLINEVFTCEDTAHCDPRAERDDVEDRNPLRWRARVAMCSLLGDVWYRPSDELPLRNLALSLADETEPDVLTLLTVMYNLMGRADLAARVDQVRGAVGGCLDDLREVGLGVPDTIPGAVCTGDLGCSDGNDCTLDECDPLGGCVHSPLPDDTLCDDGDRCSLGDRCVAQVCTPTGPQTCDDGVDCTDGTCDPEDGSCSWEPSADGTACDDGNECTVGDACRSGACAGTERTDCDDGNACTADCNQGLGCVTQPLRDDTPCDDGDACTVDDTCQAGDCVPGTARVCDDGDECTSNDCESIDGCVHGPLGEGHCDDGRPCTVDTCDPVDGCRNEPLPDGETCDPGDACVADGTCSGGRCEPGERLLCNDSEPCTADRCDPQRGCVFEPFDDGTRCDDRDLCTDDDVCTAGVCAGVAFLCEDGDPCTVGVCNEFGGCEHDPDPRCDSCTAGTVFSQDFDDARLWILDKSSGEIGWHVGDFGTDEHPAPSPDAVLRFGHPTEARYTDGISAQRGAATSGSFYLHPDANAAQLTFQLYADVRFTDPSVDDLTVFLVPTGEASRTAWSRFDAGSLLSDAQEGYVKVTVDLADFIGGAYMVQFYFDTFESTAVPDRAGLFIDDIVITQGCP